MKDKTAMQELKIMIGELSIISKAAKIIVIAAIDTKMEVEKQQIINAYLKTIGLNHASPMDDTNMTDAENYYNKTFKQ